jgi:hypothetical protein
MSLTHEIEIIITGVTTVISETVAATAPANPSNPSDKLELPPQIARQRSTSITSEKNAGLASIRPPAMLITGTMTEPGLGVAEWWN